MALKPTIYKCTINLSDFDRDYYDAFNLTIAQHPSETLERMVVRILAFCLNAQEGLAFCKGLSDVEEPDLWVKSLDDQTQCWIDVGEPAADRIKKASRISQQVKVYSFNSKSAVWWEQQQANFSPLKASVYQFEWEHIQALAALIERTMDWSVSLNGNTAYINCADKTCEVNWKTLQD